MTATRAGGLFEAVRSAAADRRDQLAYSFGDDDDQRTLTYGELDLWARGIATAIQDRCRPHDRVLLVLEPGLDYIAAFFGALYAGTVPVPIYPPMGTRDAERAMRVVADS